MDQGLQESRALRKLKITILRLSREIWNSTPFSQEDLPMPSELVFIRFENVTHPHYKFVTVQMVPLCSQVF